MKDDRLPIVVGVGQSVDRWDGSETASSPHPVRIIRNAIDRAILDTNVEDLAASIDCAAFLRSFPDSLPRPFNPFGTVDNLPRAVLNTTAIAPRSVLYSAIGGDQPQALVNSLSAKLVTGDIDIALIAGGEVTGAMKTALKKGMQLDWADSSDGEYVDLNTPELLLSRYEIQNGLGMPPQTYAALEQAWRTRMQLSTDEYRQRVSTVFARLSEVAAANPYAQFPMARDASFLAMPSKENYPICDPLLKWHVAQDAVNQSAALILTTVGKARELGVPQDKWIYLHACSDVKDTLISQRPDLSRSKAIDRALKLALADAGVPSSAINYFDLYSCFPIVVMLAAEYLGVDPAEGTVTVTGGLPFFGGPGNNYSTHAIASMVERLREDPGSYGLVLANGGFLSKESVGVYSSSVPTTSTNSAGPKLNHAELTYDPIELINTDCEATVEAFCIKHGKTPREAAFLIARSGESGRVIARIDTSKPEAGNFLDECETLVGRRVSIEHVDGKNNVLLGESPKIP